jgi:hypothetical protein
VFALPVNVHDNVLLPEPVTLVGVRVQLVLLLVRATTPLKPWRAATLIVEEPATPEDTLTLVGLALIVKSWTVNVTVVLCDRPPLVPVTVTWTS